MSHLGAVCKRLTSGSKGQLDPNLAEPISSQEFQLLFSRKVAGGHSPPSLRCVRNDASHIMMVEHNQDLDDL